MLITSHPISKAKGIINLLQCVQVFHSTNNFEIDRTKQTEIQAYIFLNFSIIKEHRNVLYMNILFAQTTMSWQIMLMYL